MTKSGAFQVAPRLQYRSFLVKSEERSNPVGLYSVAPAYFRYFPESVIAWHIVISRATRSASVSLGLNP